MELAIARPIPTPIIEHDAMRVLHERVAMLAGRPISVLVTGETGAGKEVLVEVLHAKSGRRGPLKVVNCASIPRELTESILFGHERGAFTGANVRSRGLFEEADGGTLLLDEVGELSLDVQVSLLRVLQHKRVLRVGSTTEIEVDVRIVAATHRDLQAMVASGGFREDLLYRLNAFTLHVPPLRERPQEILPLARLFLAELQREWGGPELALSREVERVLCSYAWPGNIRQLRNAIEHAAVLCSSNVIGLDSLPGELRQTQREPVSTPNARPHVAAPLAFRDRVRRFEIELISDALRRSGGNISQAARLLHLPTRTLNSKVQSWGLARSPLVAGEWQLGDL